MAANEPAYVNQIHMYKGIMYPNAVLDSSIDAMQTFEVRPDDVWVCTYPKSGTHWMMEVVGLVLSKGVPEKIDRLTHTSTIEMINTAQKFPKNREEELKNPMDMSPFADVIARATSPRVISTHLAHQLLPPKLEERAKVIYVARNPKDCLNSLYHMLTTGPQTVDMPWEVLLHSFLEDNAAYGPWLDHNLRFWNIRDKENVLFVFYEDMKKDPVTSIRQVATHIGVDLTDEELQKVVEHSSFKGMKKTYTTKTTEEKDTNRDFYKVVNAFSFMNKGVSGQWKNRFTVAQNEMFDQWFKEKTAGLDITYQFE